MPRTPLSRRALLGRAATAALGLPFLQSLMPGACLSAADPPATPAVIPRRLCVIYVPHGMYMPNFIPTTLGAGFPLPPTLQSLAPLAGRFSVIGNLTMDAGAAIMHHAGEMFLTNERISENDRTTPNRLSMDRLVVKQNDGKTLLPSLELSLMPFGGSSHRNTVAFDQNGTPLPGQHDPRAVFELLFGSTRDPAAQKADLREDRSILDAIAPQVKPFSDRLGSGDRRVLDQYLESIRETESYLQRLELRLDHPVSPEDQGVVFDDSKVSTRMRTMLDLTYLALRGDLTRVVTFVVFPERADASQQYPELGLVGEHHGWTHAYGEDAAKRPEMSVTLSAVDRLHTEQVARFLQRLRDTPEGDGTMLDHTLVLFGSGLSVCPENGIHDPWNLPLVLAGGEGLGVRQGQHVRYETPKPLASLNLTLLRLLGVEREQWKDSTGVLGELLA
jgi:hypothetical protein